MAIQKEESAEALIAGAEAFMQTPPGLEFLQKVDAAQGKVRDIKEIRELVKSIKANITGYKIKGKVYGTSEVDIETGQPGSSLETPLAGVKITILAGIIPVEKYTVIEEVKIDDPDGKKNILGKVKKIKVERPVVKWRKKKNATEAEKTIKTNAEGEYEFTFGVPSIIYDGMEVIPTVPQMLLELENYAPTLKVLVTGNGSVLRTQAPIAMLDIDQASKEIDKKLVEEAQNAANEASKKLLEPIEIVINQLRSRIMGFATIIQDRLFPLAIKLLLIFGITKLAKDSVENTRCPSDALLKECIRQRNSIVRQLNQIYVVITTNTALAITFEILTRNFQFVIKAVDNLSFPVAVPPGIGVPQSVLAQLESIKELFRDLGNLNKELRRTLLISLIFLVISLIIILRYLKKLDALIQQCAADTSNMDEINTELLALSELETAQGTPEVKVVNNFNMSVEVVQGSEVDGLYRRQAIAKNSQGIILLRGEPSFSATDQVLLDELAFYIVQNNLKAD
tara:strand:+ start:792 stop:2321 length:1530 start_codon:yes stop_codon:yes gene_type:complete